MIYFDFSLLEEIKIPKLGHFDTELKKFYLNTFNSVNSKFLAINEPSPKNKEETYFRIKNLEYIAKRFNSLKKKEIGHIKPGFFESYKLRNLKRKSYLDEIWIFEFIENFFKEELISKIRKIKN